MKRIRPAFALLIFVALLTASMYSCKKHNDPAPSSSTTGDNYASVADFFKKNAPVAKNYTINATTGGSFVSPQGTKVTIPANCFVTSSNNIASGNVTITFNDIYKKSDMLLSGMPTTFHTGAPLKSGGEFFIKAAIGDSALQIASGKCIVVTQPLNGQAADTAMIAMKAVTPPVDSPAVVPVVWTPFLIDSAYSATLFSTADNYVFSLYTFNSPEALGTWCNSDNCQYFSTYNQTQIVMEMDSLQSANFSGSQVFLIFKGINSMVHVYYDESNNNYPYNYAPVGLSCTAVAMSVNGGKLYSSFVPITISSNLQFHFNMTETTTDAFKTELNSLN